MKRLTAAVLVALLATAAMSMAEQSETTILTKVALDFKGTVTDTDNNKTSVDTTDISGAALYWATLQEVDYSCSNNIVGNVTNTVCVGVGTNVFNVLASTITTTNLVPIGGGSNLVVVVTDVEEVLEEVATVLTSKGKLTSHFAAEVGSNKVVRSIQITGTVKEDSKNPTVPKVNGKVSGVWLDGTSTVSGTLKTSKTQ